jgi:hypothetical protein
LDFLVDEALGLVIKHGNVGLVLHEENLALHLEDLSEVLELVLIVLHHLEQTIRLSDFLLYLQSDAFDRFSLFLLFGEQGEVIYIEHLKS